MKMVRFKDIHGRKICLAPQAIVVIAQCTGTQFSGDSECAEDGQVCSDCAICKGHWYVSMASGQGWSVAQKTAMRIVRERDRSYNDGDEWKTSGV